MLVRQFLHHHCHHPLHLSSISCSKLVFSTNPFVHYSSSTFPLTDSTDSSCFSFFSGMSVLTLALCARLSGLLVSFKCTINHCTSSSINVPLVGWLTKWINVRFAANCIPVLIQQNVGLNKSGAFNRSWAEFKVGFNDSRGNYWLGNDLLRQLTVNGSYKLRLDLQARDTNGTWRYAEYSSFIVFTERYNYRLHVSGYSGNAGDQLRRHDGMMFTTYDRDNDLYQLNGAVVWGAGFWYHTSWHCNFNGEVNNFLWTRYLKTSRMWLTCWNTSLAEQP